MAGQTDSGRFMTEAISVRCPDGWRLRIHDAARQDEQIPAEWMRAAIKRALEATRKRCERMAK